MSKKPNIRSLRYSDEIADLIDRQVGDNFSQKFENLVTRAFYEAPAAQEELDRINKQIEIKRWKLGELEKKAYNYERQLKNMQYMMEQIGKAIAVLAKSTAET